MKKFEWIIIVLGFVKDPFRGVLAVCPIVVAAICCLGSPKSATRGLQPRRCSSPIVRDSDMSTQLVASWTTVNARVFFQLREPNCNIRVLWFIGKPNLASYKLVCNTRGDGGGRSPPGGVRSRFLARSIFLVRSIFVRSSFFCVKSRFFRQILIKWPSDPVQSDHVFLNITR